MTRLTFYIVDVFAEAKYCGNPLAVVMGDTTRLSDLEMQQIAREMNYSETTFVLSNQPSAEGYDVRIFTPQLELPFAGHPTLGTAFVIRQELLSPSVVDLTLNLAVGPIRVTVQSPATGPDVLWMQQQPPTFEAAFSPEVLAPALSLEASDLDGRFPVQAVSTGVPFIIAPLLTQSALKRAKVKHELFFELIQTSAAKQILLFCPEPFNPANTLSARVFADYLGVPEDPATGSANGCLAAYLCQHTYFGTADVDIRVEQGYEIQRPSLLLLKSYRQGKRIHVSVGGTVIPVARGEFI
jgi:trans-2,3-dihydro-3-hydroxyanthranilate isomerase